MNIQCNILFCYSRVPTFTKAIVDYVTAFAQYSTHTIHYLDMESAALPEDLTPYDAIIFNYCFWARCLRLAPDMIVQLQRFDGVKLAILQDEYDTVPVHEKTLVDMAVDIVITCAPEPYWRSIYRDAYFERVTFFHALSGYASGETSQHTTGKPLALRPITLGYRARAVPFTYGKLTYEKYRIGVEMKKICAEHGIKADIEVSESARIYGEAWPEFIGNCRAMLGTESGSNVYDVTGTVKPAITRYLEKNPEAAFDTVYDLFLKDIEGKICVNSVSPRFFEMIEQHTALVLFIGEYAGILQPDIHYIPLMKDFSNVDAVLKKLDDIALLETMTQRCYQDIIASGRYSFAAYIAQVDALIDTALTRKHRQPSGFIPVYGLIGWRSTQRAAWHTLCDDTQIPTRTPLMHYDSVKDPIFCVRFSRAACKRQLLSAYAKILYSPAGQRIQNRLRRYPRLYKAVQSFIRTIMRRQAD